MKRLRRLRVMGGGWPMPAKHNAQQVGLIRCDGCGGEAAVYQASSSFLYTRCGECGCDQRNGKRVQTVRWWTFEPFPDAQVTRPKNVDEDRPEWLAGEGQEKITQSGKPETPAKKGAPWGLFALVGVGVFGLVKAFS